MEEIITKCGYRCDICPAYIKNLKTQADKKKACDGFLKYYGFQMQPNKIGCVGCLNEGRHEDETCPVRPCVMEKNLENCSQCETFDSCEHLQSRVEFLDPLMPKLKDIPLEDFENFVKPFQSKDRMLELRKAFLRKGS